MRVCITGATGFVGRWLEAELRDAGHTTIPAPGPEELDINDGAGVARWLEDACPDAVAHLAGIAFPPDAIAGPGEAFRVNVGGTVTLFEALRQAGVAPAVLVTGSSEVYGSPDPAALPLDEDAPIRPRNAYALSKAAQEAVAIEEAVRHGFPVAVTRSFNHTGPGQRPAFVVPAMARRVLDVRDGRASSIKAGNIDVRRDIADARDVVRAYRLLLETLVARPTDGPLVVNVASGRAISIRALIEMLCAQAGVLAQIEIDPSLVRSDDPPEIRGNPSRLRQLTGWRVEIPLEQTLIDVLADTVRPAP